MLKLTCLLLLLLPPRGRAEEAQLFATASNVFAHAVVVSYRHANAPGAQQVVTDPQGGFVSHTDCSGFVSYVLAQQAPRALAAVQAQEPRTKHPRARTYAEFFESLGTNRTASGWQAVASWRDLMVGDIIAWAPRAHTNATGKVVGAGHAMIVAAPPGATQVKSVAGKPERFVSVRVLDSSSVTHFAPEVFPPHASQAKRDGLGFGNIRLWLDEHDQPIGYWEGTWWGEGGKEIRGPSRHGVLGFGRVVEDSAGN
jgi:hypothetical protein